MIIRDHSLTKLDMNIYGIIERNYNNEFSKENFSEVCELLQISEFELYKSLDNLKKQGFIKEDYI